MQEKINQKLQQKIYHVNVNVYLMGKNAAQINGGTINEKYYICNPATYSFENERYLASIIDDSVVMRDEIIEEQKLFQQILTKKQYSAKHKISIFYLHFY